MLCKLSITYKNKYNFQYIDWSKYNFEEQLKILNTTRIIICGIGTARTNTPFIPNGSIEIQTNHHNNNLPNCISFLDTHIGTISNFVKVININSYTKDECMNKTISKDLMPNIENALKLIPYKEPLNIENNIPLFINSIKSNVTEDDFIKWRKTNSNDVSCLYKFI